MAIVTYRESTFRHGEVVKLSWELRLWECACAGPCHILGLLEHAFGIISLLQASFFFCLHCNHKNCVSLPCHGVSFVDLHWCSKVAKLPFLANLVALFIFEAPFLWSLSMSDSFSTVSSCWYMGAFNSSSMNFQTLFVLYSMSGIFGASGTNHRGFECLRQSWSIAPVNRDQYNDNRDHTPCQLWSITYRIHQGSLAILE